VRLHRGQVSFRRGVTARDAVNEPNPAFPARESVAATVEPLVPLVLLEAVRSVDLPDGDLEAEFVEELRIKRFGLSDTVLAQIRRYNEAVKRGQRATLDEAAGIAKLIGRRPDAEAVFREAGRLLARKTYAEIRAPTRKLVRGLPALLARPLALRQVRRTSRRFLSGKSRRVGASVLLEVASRDSVTLNAAPKAAGCTFYESTLRELMQLLMGAVGAVEHVRCASRGEGTCEWRAEWRSGR
jgi:predicted hydrocarbon binding protein